MKSIRSKQFYQAFKEKLFLMLCKHLYRKVTNILTAHLTKHHILLPCTNTAVCILERKGLVQRQWQYHFPTQMGAGCAPFTFFLGSHLLYILLSTGFFTPTCYKACSTLQDVRNPGCVGPCGPEESLLFHHNFRQLQMMVQPGEVWLSG